VAKKLKTIDEIQKHYHCENCGYIMRSVEKIPSNMEIRELYYCYGCKRMIMIESEYTDTLWIKI